LAAAAQQLLKPEMTRNADQSLSAEKATNTIEICGTKPLTHTKSDATTLLPGII
jgi:hypothetical protein